ncbi:unnamed protein product [Pedinophyceae sp. YPF-701]|nr:unnamed protein product [Pedinophyceae sp. YPF-701]
MDIVERVQRSDYPHLQEKFDHAVSVVERALSLYGRGGVALSFNGGKDSTVLLHITRATLALHPHLSTGEGLGLPAMFFARDDDFPEIRDFVDEVDKSVCDGRLLRINNSDYKAAMTDLVADTGCTAFLIGTRRGDPNAKGQEHFSPSTPGWANFMRVNPILDWSYSEVWAFLRETQAPYCSLYDRGYTSIGGVHNTAPNNALLTQDGKHLPAFELADQRMERAGRGNTRHSAGPTPRAGLTRVAGLLIVGDELLSAKVQDTNISFMCAGLRRIGWRVGRVCIVPDDAEDIAAVVAEMSKLYDIVITSGGIGPTLDDKTMEGISAGLGRQLVSHDELDKRMRAAWTGDDLTNAHLKMTNVPEDEDVLLHDLPGEEDGIKDGKFAGKMNPFPLVQCRNILVLPGVPSLLRKKWATVERVLIKSVPGGLPLGRFHNAAVRLRCGDETRVAPTLEDVQRRAGAEVSIGSYPVSGQEDGAGIVLSVEGKSLESVQEAKTDLLASLPEDVGVLAVCDDVEELGSPAVGARESLERQDNGA